MDFSKEIDDKRILITGGTGSFGYQMTQKLLEYNPLKISIYSRDEDKHRIMQDYFNSKKLDFKIGDVRDYERLEECLKYVDIVFHAGALKQVPAVEFNPLEAIKTNTIGTWNLMKASVANNVNKVIGISTDKAVKPVNAMGMTKALMEKLLLSNDIKSNVTRFCCVRYGNVLGSRGSVIPVWEKLIEKKKPISITHKSMRRFFLTLDEATELVLFAVKNMKSKEIFVKKAPACKIEDLAKVIAEVKTGNKDYPITYTGIRAGEKIEEELVSAEEIRHATEQKDHYIIHREEMNNQYDDIDINGFNTTTTHTLSREEISNLIKEMKWIK